MFSLKEHLSAVPVRVAKIGTLSAWFWSKIKIMDKVSNTSFSGFFNEPFSLTKMKKNIFTCVVW